MTNELFHLSNPNAAYEPTLFASLGSSIRVRSQRCKHLPCYSLLPLLPSFLVVFLSLFIFFTLFVTSPGIFSGLLLSSYYGDINAMRIDVWQRRQFVNPPLLPHALNASQLHHCLAAWLPACLPSWLPAFLPASMPREWIILLRSFLCFFPMFLSSRCPWLVVELPATRQDIWMWNVDATSILAISHEHIYIACLIWLGRRQGRQNKE
jgi:hypothetical protein